MTQKHVSVPVGGPEQKEPKLRPHQSPAPRFHTIQPGNSVSAAAREADLEGEVARCEALLRELEEEAATPGALHEESAFPQRWRRLSERLQKLASDSLERGCNRDMPGAMEVYDSANKMFDRLATLSNQPGVAACLGDGVSPQPSGGSAAAHEHAQDPAVSGPLASPRGAIRSSSRRSNAHALEQLVGEACRAGVQVLCALTCGCVEGLQGIRANMAESRVQQPVLQPPGATPEASFRGSQAVSEKAPTKEASTPAKEPAEASPDKAGEPSTQASTASPPTVRSPRAVGTRASS